MLKTLHETDDEVQQCCKQMHDLVTTLYTVSYNPCKHPHALHMCLHNEQARIFLMMETKAPINHMLEEGFSPCLKLRLEMSLWGFCRINESHTYH